MADDEPTANRNAKNLKKKKPPGKAGNHKRGAQAQGTMESNIIENAQGQPRLRVIVDIVGDDIVIFPLANSDADHAAILNALKPFTDQWQKTWPSLFVARVKKLITGWRIPDFW